MSIPKDRSDEAVHTGFSVELSAGSGFCLCDSFWIVNPKNCGHGPVDCGKTCKERKFHLQGQLNKKKSGNIQCSEPPKKCVLPPYRTVLLNLFRNIRASVEDHPPHCTIPGSRSSRSVDYVFEGKSLNRRELVAIKLGIRGFMKSAPEFPENTFQGRGIVIVGGSKKAYETPYWISVHAIRRVDPQIPIELWFPSDELPNCLQQELLEKLKVQIRTFAPVPGEESDHISGYAYKLAAMTFSSFEEILFLDADNIVLRSPRNLFHGEAYLRTGSLLWKDFWLESRAPESSKIGAKSLPGNNTHETGQVLLNKRKVWRTLLLAYYMNMFPTLFYPLSVNFMGLGDKELFAFAAAYLGEEYGLVEKGPDHIGVSTDRALVYGNTMMQHDELGLPMFLHANLGKLSANIPETFDHYTRRWQSSALHGNGILSVLHEEAGIDLESWIYVIISRLNARCILNAGHVEAPWYERLSNSLVDGMYLTDYFNINTGLDIFRELSSKGYTFNK